MSPVATTRLSSKGQIVIPEEVRARLGLKAGDEFVVVGEDDVIVLKVIVPPHLAQFDALVARARTQAIEAGLTSADLEEVIAISRGR